MSKKYKRIKIGLIISIVLFIAAVAALVTTRMALVKLQEEHTLAQIEMDANKQTIYVVSTADGAGIKHGDIIEENVNVVKQMVYTGLESTNYITQDDLGSTAIVDMNEGMTVMKNMVTAIEIAKDTREYEISVCNLMVDQKENDIVDVRIMFPDGADKLVLPKKQIKNLSLEECVFWTYLNEEEILRMASAIIDAFTITGTKIYTTRYVESNLQEEAVPTYLVNSVIQDMMDPTSAYYDSNLLTKAITTLNSNARLSMEHRLGTLSKEKLDAVAEGHNLEDTAKSSVLTGLGGYDYEEAIGSNNEVTEVDEIDNTSDTTDDDSEKETPEDVLSTEILEE